MEWKELKKQQPEKFKILLLHCVFVNALNGTKSEGLRLGHLNAFNKIELSGDDNFRLKRATHWMYAPNPPII